MYAIIRSGNKQYRVEKGDRIAVEKLPQAVGDQVTLEDVIFVGDGDKFLSGSESKGASVVAKVVAVRKGPKVITFDYRNKHRRRTTHGHRQTETHLEIKDIFTSKQETESK